MVADRWWRTCRAGPSTPAADVELPPGRHTSPRTTIDTEHRWQLARRLVTDDTIAPDDRLAGALAVLYAQPLTRIATLTTSDVRHANGVTTVNLAGTRLELPEPFATLTRQLPHRRRAGTADQLPTHWLLPARRPNQHISVTALGDRLRRLGIQPRAMRLAAVAQLAGEIPPAVLADAIGITARTAATWVTTSGGNWTAYTLPTGRAEHLDQRSTTSQGSPDRRRTGGRDART